MDLSIEPQFRKVDRSSQPPSCWSQRGGGGQQKLREVGDYKFRSNPREDRCNTKAICLSCSIARLSNAETGRQVSPVCRRKDGLLVLDLFAR